MAERINESPEYHDYSIPELRDNPLIAGLRPPPANLKETVRRLSKHPSFNESERNLDSATRMLLPARLRTFFFPNGQHVQIFGDMLRQIVGGYIVRNPMTRDGQKLLYNAVTPGFRIGPINPSTISFITGLSGQGKSALVKAIKEALGPAVIRHSNFKGTPFPETQILCLMRNVPDQCGPKALAKVLGDHTDELLGNENLYGKLFSDRSTRTQYVATLRKIVACHHVGVVILDEFQNLSLAKPVGREELIALLVNMRDELGIPIVLVGTYKAANVLADSACIARRLSEGGFHDLKRPEAAEDESWRTFCEIVWNYQWVRRPVDFHEDIVSTLYECSQGIAGIMLTVFIAAQVDAIDSGIERVDADLLRRVYERRFQPLHKIIDALCRNDLNRFDDLYIKAIPPSKQNQPLGRRVNVINGQENQLDVSMDRGKEIPPDRTTEELAAKVLGASTVLPGVLA